MALPVAKSYSGRINSPIIGGKFLRKYAIGASVVQANIASAAAVSSGATLHQVVMANVGQANLASSVYLQAPAIPSGVWSQITVSPYSFVPTRGTDGNPRYDSGVSRSLTDAGSAITAAIIPFREYSRPTPTDHGVLYYHGGLHSGYAGNDILKITLGASLSVEQLARPHVPAAGDIGYSTSGTPAMYRDYATAFSVGERDQWEPYTYHNYCKNVWHPQEGYLLTTTYPVSWDGSGYPVSSLTAYGPSDAKWHGSVKYNESTHKYTLFSAPTTGNPITDISDYSAKLGGIIGISESYGVFRVSELTYKNGNAWQYVRSITPNAATGSAAQGNAANGIPIKLLEGSLYVLVNNVNANFNIFTYDHASGEVAAVSLPVANTGTQDYVIQVDRAGRRLFCAVLGSPVRVFVSYFGALSSWTELSISSAPNMLAMSAALGREPLHYWKNTLYLLDFYGGNYYRASLGDSPPEVTLSKVLVGFTSNAGFDITNSKHTNLAYCPLNNSIYMIGGDVVNSYSQEMFRYNLGTSTWSQIQNACGADPSGNANGVLPINPDDGGLFWDDTDAKFWWLPGGGQMGQSSNLSYLHSCSDMPTDAEWANLYSLYSGTYDTNGKSIMMTHFNALSRWKAYEAMTFDPIAGVWAVEQLTVTHRDGWVDSTLAKLYGGESNRGNAYDPVARKQFRIIIGGGFHLFAIDHATRTWRPFTCAKLADGSYFNYGDLQYLGYGHQSFAVDPATGHLYFIRPATGDLVQIDTRATPTLYDGTGPMYTLPIRVMGNPIIPVLDYTYADHAFLRIFKGGILFWYLDASGLGGDIRGAWWRSLTNVETSTWIPIQLPFDFVTNSVSTNQIATDQYFVPSSGALGSAPRSAWTLS